MIAVDGDTVIADIGHGFNVWVQDENLRLDGIDGFATGTVDGAVVAYALRDRIENQTLHFCRMRNQRPHDRLADR